MTRSASFLAALASAALPGLDPVSVQSVRTRSGDRYDVAYVEDSDARHWVVQAPRTPVAGALLEDVTELSALLSRRLDLAVPAIAGQVVVPEGRAVVFPALPGRPLDFSALPPGLGLAADVGRALAHIHNLEVELFDEAGRPAYDASTTRTRLLTDLDRAAATGQVPTALLSRWEHALEHVSLWHFLPTPVHGSFTGSSVLASFEDDEDADSGRVRAVLDWGESHVGDPAEDFADLASCASRETVRSVLDAYAPSRVDGPDPHLLHRARLLSELRLIRALLSATAADEMDRVEETVRALRSLAERVLAEHQDEQSRGDAGRKPRRALLSEDSEAGMDALDGAAHEPLEGSSEGVGGETSDRVKGGTEAGSAESASARRPRTTSPDVATVALPVASGEAPTSDGDRDTPGDPTDQRPAPRAADEAGAAPGPHAPARSEAVPQQRPESSTDGEDPPIGGAERARRAPTTAPPIEFEIPEPPSQEDDPAPDGGPAQEDGEGWLDLHEGASEFVPVERRPRGPETSSR